MVCDKRHGDRNVTIAFAKARKDSDWTGQYLLRKICREAVYSSQIPQTQGSSRNGRILRTGAVILVGISHTSEYNEALEQRNQ